MYDSPAVVAAPGHARSNNQLFDELLQRFELTRAGDLMTDDELVATTFAASPDSAQLQQQLAEHGAAVSLSDARPITFVDVFPSTPDQRVHLVPAALDQVATHGLYT